MKKSANNLTPDFRFIGLVFPYRAPLFGKDNALVFAVAAIMSLNCGSKGLGDHTARPEFHANYEVRLPFTGALRAVDSSFYSSSVPNKTMKVTWLVDEGIFIEEGDLLVRFDDSELKAELRELERKKVELEQELEKTREDFRFDDLTFKEMMKEAGFNSQQSQRKLDQFVQFTGPSKLKQLEQERHLTSLKVNRLERESGDLELLAEKGHVTIFELDMHRENLLKAKYQLDKADFELRTYSKHGMHDEKIALEKENELIIHKLAQLEKKYELFQSQQKNKIERLQARISENLLDCQEKKEHLIQAELRAKHDGLVIYCKNFRDGKQVKPSVGFEYRRAQPILNVQNTNKLFVNTRINEFLLNKVEVGMSAILVADAKRSLTFPGRISFIGLLAEFKTDDAEKGFDMNIEIQEAPPGLRPGMSVRCEVVTSTYQSIWTLPRNCLASSQNQTFCQIYRQGKKLELDVDVLEYDQQIAIVEGAFQPRDLVLFN